MNTLSTPTKPARNGSRIHLTAQPKTDPTRGKKGPEADYQKLVDRMLEARKAALWEICSLLDEISPAAESLLHDYLGLNALCNVVLTAIPLTDEGERSARKTITSLTEK